ncbi:DUF4238 domain-containing protein [Rahnella sp. CG8]|uniref:DUF4238 domain-containing protein n=1 Tax=Rahnella sp. CG8 TaxID=2726078 RepID=UPI002033BA99|nr:DUF4238 domain-containing protein [Rahnella sp. CG8]MCM2446227.1 DUF4238 domain-containing protein [Rahnella sp. CG8]
MASPLPITTNVIRQHTVPYFLLKLFTGTGKRRRFWGFDKTRGRAYQTNPRDATVRNTFYNLDDHPERMSLEPLMAIYETDAAPVIHDLLAHRDIRRLSADDRYRLAVFVAVQRARTYGEQQRIHGFVQTLTNKIGAMGASPDQSAEMLDFSPQRDARNLFLGQLVQQDSHIDHILAKDWYLCESTPDHPFYISDSPVVLHNDKTFGPYGNLGLALPGIQIYLPLSSTVTLAMFCPSIREEKMREKREIQIRMAYAPHTIPHGYNPFLRIAAADVFINHELIKVEADQVMRFNSLQVRFSEQYIFCEKNDFLLVERMIADDPGFKSGMRITFG